MKKIMLALALLCCSYLYAETKSLTPEGSIYFSEAEPDSTSSYYYVYITAILPYQDGCILKYTNKSGYCIERFITKGYIYYTYKTYHGVTSYYKNIVIDIKPNELIVEKELIKEERQSS